ncbi:hypothetical protein RJ640_029807 [Escallonia rubra]|uniref:FAE domain-containing protein n=1 Tax=Escallonia rubra TaxID=112253 RepID=A0AA88URU8_9ASTE|nr:hypothetical protein RJ640_029807 [Escallonia rubra]
MPSSLPLSTAQLQFDDTNIDFQTQILEKSGFSEETCLHPSLCRLPRTRSLSLSIEEAATVMFSMVAAAWVAGKACLRVVYAFPQQLAVDATSEFVWLVSGCHPENQFGYFIDITVTAGWQQPRQRQC